MNTIDIANLLGTTENSLMKNYKRFEDRVRALGYERVGRGKNTTFKKIENQNLTIESFALEFNLSLKMAKNILAYCSIVIKDNKQTEKEIADWLLLSERQARRVREIMILGRILKSKEEINDMYLARDLSNKLIELTREEYDEVHSKWKRYIDKNGIKEDISRYDMWRSSGYIWVAKIPDIEFTDEFLDKIQSYAKAMDGAIREIEDSIFYNKEYIKRIDFKSGDINIERINTNLLKILDDENRIDIDSLLICRK